MASSDSYLYMERIFKKANQGKCALFIGAGVSQAAGAPSTSDFVATIQKTFSRIRFETNNFIDVCQAVIDSDYYDGRKELEDLIRRILLDVKPTNWHLALTEHNWAAIFTTNFDDLIEESYRRQTRAQKRDYHCILTDDFSIVDRSTLHIFKLMGTLQARRMDPGRMVLSRLDFINSLKMRAKCIEMLSDIVRDGTVVFIGYSGRDQLAFEVMGGVLEKYGKDSLAKSYMLLDDLSSIEGQKLKFSRHNMIPIKCSFEEFVDFLSKKPTKERPTSPGQTVVGVSGFDLTFLPRDTKECQRFFHIMNEKDHDEAPGKTDEFFKGINKSWGAYKKKLDFQRDFYADPKNGVHKRIKDELSKIGPKENRVLMIGGMPGIGKTMMLRRIAYDCYGEGVPVLIFDLTKSKFNFRLLDSFLMTLDRQLLRKSEGKMRNAKSLIIFDDVFSTTIDPMDLSSYLASRGRSSLIISSARVSDGEEDFGLDRNDILTIPQKLSQNECHRLAEHLKDLGYLPSAEIWEKVIMRELESSFFAAMYTLVDPAKRPLGQIIHDQFTQLSDMQQKIFICVCAFHRFNLPINLELLCRVACNNNYTTLMKELGSRKMSEILYTTVDSEENTLYSTHNRIVAKRTIDFFLTDRERQKELYSEILDKAHFSLQKERELVEKLLIRNIGPNRNVSDLKLPEQLELFSLICRKNPTRSLLHHLGLLQIQTKNFSRAEATLNRALKFRERFFSAFRGESTRNIMTSLGSMYVNWAEDRIAAGGDSPDVLFDKAEKYLKDAMRFRYPMPHPYHALARMYMRIGDRCGEDVEKLEFYAKALEVIDSGKKNVYGKKATILYEIETMVFTHLQDQEAIEKAISILETKYKSARGYYLYAKTLLIKSKTMRPRERKEILNEALSRLYEAVMRFPTDEPCLRLRAEIFKTLYPLKEEKILKTYFGLLEKWFQVSRWHSSEQLYDLGVTAFRLKYFKTSFKRFSRLDKISQGHPERFVVKEYMQDRKGQKIVYKGTILQIKSLYEGEIRVDSIPGLDYNIRFSLEMLHFAPQEGQAVSFFIGFDYVSPKAVDVRKQY